MLRRLSFNRLRWCAACAVWLFAARGAAGDDLLDLEQRAQQQAVAAVTPAVVTIETIGGVESVDRVLLGTGPTTGLIVTPDGYIISSAFNFAQRPSSILVSLSDGQRVPARLVATDHLRMLTLLKVDVVEPQTVAAIAPEDELAVGQWALALGRTHQGRDPAVAIGIISALDRIWGKAIQTDANVSPANYGGPLVDIRGRVMGLLVAISPDGKSDVAGLEWYDSGIGFAIPMETINEVVLPRLREGRDLYPGVAGLSLKGDPLSEPPIVAAARVNSPAARAGLKPDDVIVRADQQEVRRLADLRRVLSSHYAGDAMTLVVRRGDERLDRTIDLVEKLEPYEHPFLGILALLGGPATDAPGVAVRYVYPHSPAAAAGIVAGERITAMDGQPIQNRDALVERLNTLASGQKIRLKVEGKGGEREVALQLASLPVEAPDDVPAATEGLPPAAGELPKTGQIELRVGDRTEPCSAFVPNGYDSRFGHALAIVLRQPGATDEAVFAPWKRACEQHGLIVLAPAPSDGKTWQVADVELIVAAVDALRAKYQVDPLRIVVVGADKAGMLAYLLAFTQRELIRGAAVTDATLPLRPLENEPLLRLAFYIGQSDNSPAAKRVTSDIGVLTALRYPVTAVDRAAQQGDFTEAEVRQVARWIDTLDRL